MAQAKSNANIGFEEKLWKAADKLRGSMDSSEYKHVVLGLLFLKYVYQSSSPQFNRYLYIDFAYSFSL